MKELIQTRSVRDLDGDYEQLGCIGRGGFASVFLAEKRTSGRRVAIKVMVADDSGDEGYWEKIIKRELESVSKLNRKMKNNEERDMNTIFFREYYMLSSIRRAAYIVMNYIDGGTLSNEIKTRASKAPLVPYSERRIAWYMLQIAEALAYAHERGVAHHDVKSANILIDRSGGGKLVLTDFGASVAPGEDSVGFTPSHASPELMLASTTGDCSALDPVKVDSFGLGCILVELLSCQLLTHFTSGCSNAFTTLAQVALAGGVDAVLSLSCLRVPWVPAQNGPFSTGSSSVEGYSFSLRNLAAALLDPDASTRSPPSDFPAPLRNEVESPLVANYLAAVETAIPGTPVTMDNIQLGTLVQRGPDWQDGVVDGGPGSIGVVVGLDADALYTKVVWPTNPSETFCYRIGAGQKYELNVGPCCLGDTFGGMDNSRKQVGVLVSRDPSKYSVGMKLTENSVVVALRHAEGIILVAPTIKISPPTTALSATAIQPPAVTFLPPRDPEPHPAWWQLNHGLFCEVTDTKEWKQVLDLFHAPSGGMSSERFAVVSLKRIQSVPLWYSYANSCERIAGENWGMVNECRLFHGTRSIPPEQIAQDPVGFDPRFCEKGMFGRGSYFAALSSYSDKFHHSVNYQGSACRQMFLARVALGRVHDSVADTGIRRPPRNHHSIAGRACLPSGIESSVFVIYETVTQALPEYLITYREKMQHEIVEAPPQNHRAAPNCSGNYAAPVPIVFSVDSNHNLKNKRARR